MERAPASLRTERPELMQCVVNERHRERLRGGRQLDRCRVGGAERDAALATAETLGLRLPASDALEFRDRNAGAREQHSTLR